MSRRSLNYKKLKGLEDARKLGELEAITSVRGRSHWDPTSEIPKTGPEREVYNYLVRLGVRFEFQYHMFDSTSTAFPEDIWIPDFTLPDYNVILEIYGYYWHSIPRRREGDQLKKAYWLHAGYTVYENGVPLYPEGGMSSGKAVIWWDWEIYQALDHLFSRDLPELLSPDRITGEPEEYILNAEQEKLRMQSQRAASIVRKMKPKSLVYEKKLKTFRKRLFDLNRIYPIVKELEEYAIPKIKKDWKI